MSTKTKLAHPRKPSAPRRRRLDLPNGKTLAALMTALAALLTALAHPTPPMLRPIAPPLEAPTPVPEKSPDAPAPR